MKTAKIICIVALLSAVMSCNDDFMERYPISALSPETFFSSEAELYAYTNGLFGNLGSIYSDDKLYGIWQGDDLVTMGVPAEAQGTRTVPTSGGGWDWAYLRSINFFLENSHKCSDVFVRAKYDGIARFHRAWFYFEKIDRFGDVPWYDQVIGQHDKEMLTKARDSRGYIFERMLEDIDYAIANCGTERSATSITRWTALALKSRMCLFEGTFRKYHGRSGWEDILAECISASDEMIQNSGYQVYESAPDRAYLEMFLTEEPNDEFILAQMWSLALSQTHYVNLQFTGPSYSHPGMTRSLFNSYLNADGTRFTDMSGYGTRSFYESTQNRDLRLRQSIRTQGYTYPGSATVRLVDFQCTTTAYQIAKYVTNISTINGSNAFPYLRYAEVLLNYAEAKAELGDITQADIDRSIRPLRNRVNMPNLDMAAANANPDPFLAAQYPGVTGDNKGIILEIRRERRVELFLENHRWRDIRRWKEGQLLTRYPRGAYFSGVGEHDLDGDGTPDLVIYSGAQPPTVAGRQYVNIADLNLTGGMSGGEIQVNPQITRRWDEGKDYLYPIPIQELQLNPNLIQNPGWATE